MWNSLSQLEANIEKCTRQTPTTADAAFRYELPIRETTLMDVTALNNVCVMWRHRS